VSTLPMSVWVPVIAALAGGLIASVAPIVVGLVQSHAEHRRELLRLATQLAIEENNAALAAVKLMPGKSASITPTALNLVFHLKLLTLLAKGPISRADVVDLGNQASQVFPK